ncbi:MAG: hypothetical protein AAGD13_10915 [Pseudomonadota bacterium]
MRRIMIVGGSGSGKSTLAREIGTRLGLPVIHMDTLFWEPGWIVSEEQTFRARVADAIRGDAWVMDGNYSRTWPERLLRSDTVIFLDLPAWLRFFRVIRRTLRGYGRSRPDLGADCPERIDLGFLFGWVLQYGRRGRPKALKLMADDGPASRLRRYRLGSTGEVTEFLNALAAEQGPRATMTTDRAAR